jgi:hypothetical protein
MRRTGTTTAAATGQRKTGVFEEFVEGAVGWKDLRCLWRFSKVPAANFHVALKHS